MLLSMPIFLWRAYWNMYIGCLEGCSIGIRFLLIVVLFPSRCIFWYIEYTGRNCSYSHFCNLSGWEDKLLTWRPFSWESIHRNILTSRWLVPLVVVVLVESSERIRKPQPRKLVVVVMKKMMKNKRIVCNFSLLFMNEYLLFSFWCSVCHFFS